MQIAGPVSKLITQIDAALVMPCFLIFIVLLYLNRAELRKAFQKIRRRSWLYLAIIFLSGLLLRIFLSPRYYMIIPDEGFIVQLSKNILLLGSPATDSYYLGWPFLASSALGLFGLSNLVPIYLNILLGALTPLVMFLAAYLILGSQEKAITAALLLSFASPLIIWSGNAEIYTSSIFFILISILLSFLYFRRGSQLPFLLALSSIVFTSLIRPENFLFLLLFGLGLLLFRPIEPSSLGLQKAKKLFLPLLALSLIFLISCLRLLILFLPGNHVQLDTYGAESAKDWSFANLLSNSREFGQGIFTFYPPLLVVPALILGIVLMLKKRGKECLYILFWLLLIYLVNYASWKTHFIPGYLTRQHMQFIPAITLFLSVALTWLRGSLRKATQNRLLRALPLLLIIGIIYSSALSLAGFQKGIDPHLRLEITIPGQLQEEISEDCVIISSSPEMLEPNLKHKLLSIEEVMNNPTIIQEHLARTGCVLFYEGSVCKYSLARLKANISAPPAVAAIDSRCAYMYDNFSLSTYKEYAYGNATLKLYRLAIK